MPAPNAPQHFRSVEVGHNFIVVSWEAPRFDGGSPITYYEVQINGRAWESLGRSQTTVRLQSEAGIPFVPNEVYRLLLRAVNADGASAPTPAIIVQTLSIVIVEKPRFVTAEAASDSIVWVRYHAPLNTTVIDRYEVRYIQPDGTRGDWESTSGNVLEHPICGLAADRRYGFEVRAVNAAGAGPESDAVYAVSQVPPDPPPIVGRRIPVLPNALRQSMIIRLENIDCRLSLWYQPWDASWYAAMEIPANSLAVSGIRLAADIDVLQRAETRLEGAIRCFVLDANDSGDPRIDAWSKPTHGLFYVPA